MSSVDIILKLASSHIHTSSIIGSGISLPVDASLPGDTPTMPSLATHANPAAVKSSSSKETNEVGCISHHQEPPTSLYKASGENPEMEIRCIGQFAKW